MDLGLRIDAKHGQALSTREAQLVRALIDMHTTLVRHQRLLHGMFDALCKSTGHASAPRPEEEASGLREIAEESLAFARASFPDLDISLVEEATAREHATTVE